MLDKNKELVLTVHAIERAKQFGVSIKGLKHMFWGSIKEPRPPGARKYSKYASTTSYWRNGTFVMTVGEPIHKEKGQPIYLLLTIYDQRMDL